MEIKEAFKDAEGYHYTAEHGGVVRSFDWGPVGLAEGETLEAFQVREKVIIQNHKEEIARAMNPQPSKREPI